MDGVFEKTVREMAEVSGWPVCDAAMLQAIAASRRLLCLDDLFGKYFADLAKLHLTPEAEARAATAIAFNGTLTQEHLAEQFPGWPHRLRSDIDTPQVKAILKRVLRRWKRVKYGKGGNPHFIFLKPIPAGICVYWPTWLYRTDRVGGAALLAVWQSKWEQPVDTLRQANPLTLQHGKPIRLDTFERARDRLGLANPTAPTVSSEALEELVPEVKPFLPALRAQAKVAS